MATRLEARCAAPSSRHFAERLVALRTGPVRRERRILFDGVRSEIHPYDVTVERPGAAEA